MVQHAVIAGIVAIAVGTGAAAYLLLGDDGGNAPLSPSDENEPSPAYPVPPGSRTRGPSGAGGAEESNEAIGFAAVSTFEPSPAFPAPKETPPLEIPSTEFPPLGGSGDDGDEGSQGGGQTAPPEQWYDSIVDLFEQNAPIPFPGAAKGLLNTLGPVIGPHMPDPDSLLPVCPALGTCVPGDPPSAPDPSAVLATILGLLPVDPNQLPVDPDDPGLPPLPVDPDDPGVPGVPGVPEVPDVPDVPSDPDVPDPDTGLVDDLLATVMDNVPT